MGTGESHPAIERISRSIESGEPSATLPELDPRTPVPEGIGTITLRRIPETLPGTEMVSSVVMTEFKFSHASASDRGYVIA